MKITFKTLLFLILIFQLFSCKKSNKEKIVEKKPVNEIISNSKVTTTNTKIDSTDNYSFPVDSILKVEILATGNFHEDEVNEKTNEKKWFGLFKTLNGYKLYETELITKRVNDPVVDENENDETGWEVNTTINDTCLILIEKLPYLTEREIATIKIPETIHLGEKLNFSFSGINYTLFATGEKKREDENSDSFVVSNYKLYLTANKNGKEQTELIVAQSNFDDKMIQIIFAGDIDGDNKLDLIIDTSNHYNVSRLTMYLSKPAEHGKIIKPIGMFTSVGC
ncbi:hypothetical protein FNW52_03690 [Flavobacterium sp. ZT3R18]|uniref:VCBS repeat-containing protein n=1 Tax=Flavobacterium sp. ZT3R18 TaxID=2594429 RepID=UPI00117A6972|nr:VCBS repeat-containing protein [Flavobacterium sp. ZT3R18]TRX38014.1 hypothetical protein FNW52_03690 [Flavobacterium sp. ZT3R18]